MFRLSAVISLTLIIISLGLIYTNLTESGRLLILRWGDNDIEKIIGARNDVLRVTVTGLLLILLNIFLARSFWKKIPLLTRIISFVNPILALLILTVIGGIILGN